MQKLVPHFSRRVSRATLLFGIFFSSMVVNAGYDDAPINYNSTAPRDPIAILQAHLDRGEITLARNDRHGYLESVLKQLHIPASSQGLVLSKTSIQHEKITPRKPRAVYFNDDTYVGYARDGKWLELASMEPQMGAVFYVLDQHADKPKFVRKTYDCLQCHLSENSQSVPGLLMRSVYPDLEGNPIQSAGSFVTTDRSPFRERWGGWYVTGNYGEQVHMGNMTCDDQGHTDQVEFSARANVPSVAKFINATPYLRDTSDVVALMVLGHQQHVHNLITSTNHYIRTVLYESKQLSKGKTVPLSPEANLRIEGACEQLVLGLLFSGEAKLKEPVNGTSGFAEDFSAVGPKGPNGRSLREFDLKHRLFKYPCSYLIYSDQFDGLPVEAKSVVYRRMWAVLSGRDQSRPFVSLTKEDRQGILEILLETKKEFTSQQLR